MDLAATLSNTYAASHAADAARLLAELPEDLARRELEDLDTPSIVAMLTYAAPLNANRIIALLDRERREQVIRAASPRVAVLLLARLDDADREALLANMPAALRADIERQLIYPEDSAGRLMDTHFITFTPDQTVAQALAELRASGLRRQRTVYVVDEDNRLSARVDVQDLALADGDAVVATLMAPVVATVDPLAAREEIVNILDEHRIDSLPVVDSDGRLMGVVRHATLMRAIEEVATADLQRMVGGTNERALSPPGDSVRNRLPWLHINLLTAFLAAAVVGVFEDTIARFTALAVLLPVVAGQSGNAGSQALAVTIRGLALREIGVRNWPRVLTKETVVGLVNGSVLAVSCGLGVLLWSRSLGLAVVIGVAMVLSLLAAGIAGALVPMVLTRLGQDPATASSIILTTVTDVCGFVSFLGTATLFSGML